MPCPNGVKIPTIFRIYRELVMYRNIQVVKRRYHSAPCGVGLKYNTANCIHRENWYKAYLQYIPFVDWLKKVPLELIFL